MREYKLSVKAIHEGQPRPYADSYYEYEVEAEGCNEFTVKDFCTRYLRPCKQTYAEWNKNDANSYFSGYYEFSKISENKYRYYKKEPFTD